MSAPHGEAELGVVVIGRNEGQRLVACLESVRGAAEHLVYVDSGSSDGSVETARKLGAVVVELDPSVPFTAARARNAGVERLLELAPETQFVQMVDGDCELVEGWFDAARTRLTSEPTTAIVCGRRRERYPERSVYNRLADMEWDTPVGFADACGGDALVRLRAFVEVGGYDAALICGEEPEMCARMRARGYRIERIAAEMTRHDAAILRFSQWWRRSMRGGWAAAEASATYGRNSRRARGVWIWGLALPLAAVGAAWPTQGLSLLALGLYPVLALRVFRGRRARGSSPADAALYAAFIVLGKFPEAWGQLAYWRARLARSRATLIEYKRAEGLG